MVALIIGAIALVEPAAAHAGTSTGASVTASTIPSRPVFSQLALHDTTVMQGFAYDSTNKVWVFSQLMGGGRFGVSGTAHADAGDMTLTEVSSSGQVLGHMYLKGFGHGVSIGLEPVGRTTYVWTEADAKISQVYGGVTTKDAFGTKIARFAWRNDATITGTSPGVTVYALNNSFGAVVQEPTIDYPDKLLATQYFNRRRQDFQWAIYPLRAVEQHKSYRALTRLSWPGQFWQDHDTFQGWTIMAKDSILFYAGTAYSSTNPQPGDAFLTTIAAGVPFVSSDELPVDTADDLVYREPEGTTNIDGDICTGFASGKAGARRANVFCQSPVH